MRVMARKTSSEDSGRLRLGRPGKRCRHWKRPSRPCPGNRWPWQPSASSGGHGVFHMKMRHASFASPTPSRGEQTAAAQRRRRAASMRSMVRGSHAQQGFALRTRSSTNASANGMPCGEAAAAAAAEICSTSYLAIISSHPGLSGQRRTRSCGTDRV